MAGGVRHRASLDPARARCQPVDGPTWPAARALRRDLAALGLDVSHSAALEFHTAVLGFKCSWEHRPRPDLPLHARVRRDDAELDLSEHHGDGTPGTVVRVPVRDVRALRRELSPRLAPRQFPGVEDDAPGGPTMTVLDPSGNSLRFCRQG
ncbi:glyoxalase superfamily protein [Kineococcus endophyticus]|uniref:Glyoxalase superfamily protein n=1 Tax=Kineococcus endophyticus TaxID=1181883 RepID=A0ABV3PBJ0_9ACTN